MLNTISVFIFCSILSYNVAIIRPASPLIVTDGEGFLAYLEVSEYFGEIKRCYYQYKAEEVIQINLFARTHILTARGEEILPFATNICGIRVNNVNIATTGKWKLIAESASGINETGAISIIRNEARKAHFETRVQKDLALGYSGYLGCTKYVDTEFCEIIDNEGKVIKGCGYATTLRPNTTYQCNIFKSGSMEKSHELITIDYNNKETKTNASVVDNVNNLILRCQAKTKFKQCKVQKPADKNSLLIMEGLYNGRYSSYDTLCVFPNILFLFF